MRKILALLFVPMFAFGATRHVIPSGGLTSGTAADSAHGWTLAYLAGGSSAATAGDTVILHGTFSLSSSLGFYPDGAAGNLLVIENCPTCGARITKSNAGNMIEWYSDYCEFLGIEFDFTLASPTTEQGTPIFCRGNGSKIVNCIIHDAVGTGIADQSEANGTEITGNLIYYNGRRSSGTHGYSIYSQNANAPGGSLSWKIYRDNIIFSQFGDYAFHLYGESAAIDSFQLYRNIVFTGVGAKTVVLIDGGLDNIVDTTYYYGYRDPSWLYLGGLLEYTPGTRPLYRGNYWMRALLDWGSATTGRVYANNVNYGRSPVYDGGSSYVDTSDYSGDGNTWSIAQWPAEATKPTGTVAKVHVNPHVSTRANVVVYNWDSLASVNVKVTPVFADGDTLLVIDAQNYFAPASWDTVVVASDSISLDMTLTGVASPVSNPLGTSVAHTDRKFNAFIVTKLSGGGAAPPATPQISLSGSFTVFAALKGENSAAQSFTVGGSDLTDTLVITAPSQFTVSLSAGSGYVQSLNLVPTDGTVTSTTIYTRYTPTDWGSTSGTVTCESAGATSKNLSVSGIASPLKVLLMRNRSR